MKKILVMYATAGIGHKKASLAVKQALDELRPQDVRVEIADSLDHTNAFFKWAYLESYLLMVSRLPTFWGLLYYLTDNFLVNLAVSKIRRMSNWLNTKKLRGYLTGYRPDVVISTHFFASEVISDMKKNGALDAKLITVVTDYRLHSWWVSSHTDFYAVGGEEAKDDLIKRGVDRSRIKVLGIPAEPLFAKKPSLDRGVLRQNIGLAKDAFTILVIGGGFGVGPIIDIVKAIDEVRARLQTIVICGHNDKLVKQLEGMKPSLRHPIQIHGYVHNVYELMDIADLLISKSGGITVTESLAKGLPMVVIAPIIGQETRNCEVLLSNGAAVKADRPSDLRGIIEDLAACPDKIKAMKDAIARIRKPAACYDIAKLGIEECGNG